MRGLYDDEFYLLGAAIIAAQRAEFALYGIAAHIAKAPGAQRERRFRDLDPERFLRGDPGELKATLGQLVEAFGDELFIYTPDLVRFYQDRNLIARDYQRVFRMVVEGRPKRQDGRAFLQSFIKRALYWEDVLRGALSVLMEAVAKKSGREAELKCTSEDRERMRLYYEQAASHPSVKTHIERQREQQQPTEEG